jgi:hypothetical protein
VKWSTAVTDNNNQPSNDQSPDERRDDAHEQAEQNTQIALTFDRVLEILDKGEVDVEHGSIRWSSNYTFLLSLRHDDLSVMCVYKPRAGERPLWDFPDGTLCLRERASFLTSQALGWQIIPPTTLRDGPRGTGSMQFYIDHDPDYNYFSFDETLKPQLARLALFDCIVNNADRKGGHCLVDRNDHLWGIDQGLTFNIAHKLRTVIWDFAGQHMPQVLLNDVMRLCDEMNKAGGDYFCELQTLLAPQEVVALQRRLERLVRSGRYPKPGPGPNYPWPPV